MANLNVGDTLQYTASLFGDRDYECDELVPKGSNAFTAVRILPDNDFVEVFELGRPIKGVHTYEFRGLGTDETYLTTTRSLDEPEEVIAAVQLALQARYVSLCEEPS
jgi:hypothetical protein